MTLVVREATPDDAQAVARVDIDSHIEAYRHIFGDGYLRDATLESFVDRWLRLIKGDPSNPQVPEHVMVATVDGEVTGYVCFGRSRDEDGPDVGEIGAIYVQPVRWRLGTGRALMAAAFQGLQQQGFTEATLWALEENHIGRAFYSRERWLLDGSDRTGRHGHVEVRYRKQIG